METEKLPEILTKPILKKLPFQVPEGYFAGFSANLNERMNLEAEEESDVFSKPEYEGLNWSIPSGYFDTLPEMIGKRIDHETAQHATKIVSMWSRWKVLAAAASVLLLLFVGLDYFKTSEPNYSPENLALAGEDIEKYLLEANWQDQPQVQIWLAGQDAPLQNNEWLNEIDHETIENELENYDDELFTN